MTSNRWHKKKCKEKSTKSDEKVTKYPDGWMAPKVPWEVGGIDGFGEIIVLGRI